MLVAALGAFAVSEPVPAEVVVLARLVLRDVQVLPLLKAELLVPGRDIDALGSVVCTYG